MDRLESGDEGGEPRGVESGLDESMAAAGLTQQIAAVAGGR